MTIHRPSLTPADIHVVLADLAGAIAALPQAVTQLGDMVESSGYDFDLSMDTLTDADDPSDAIGLARLHTKGKHDEMLMRIQHDLFDLGGALATPGAAFNAEKLTRLDSAIEHYNAALPPLKEFILPGGCRAAALCHVARSVARRAERDYFQLMQKESAPAEGLKYLNRLSDLLFVLSRVLNRYAGGTDVLWKHERKTGK